MEKLTLDYACRIIAQCIKKVNSDFGGRPISVSICDEHGDVIALQRTDGAAPRSAVIAQRKAYTAARAGVSTDALFTRIQRENLEISYFCDPLFTAFPGGNLLKNQQNSVIGSIGISGLQANEDHAVTEFIAQLVNIEQI